MNKTQRAIVEAFEKGYRVTDDGEVISPSGVLRKTGLSTGKSTRYKTVSLPLDGKSCSVRVHRLCAFQKYKYKCFDKSVQVRHLNNDSFDNRPSNIAIGSASENHMDMPKKQRIEKAKKAGMANARKDWALIDAVREGGMSYKQIEKEYGVPRSSLSYRYGKRKAAT